MVLLRSRSQAQKTRRRVRELRAGDGPGRATPTRERGRPLCGGRVRRHVSESASAVVCCQGRWAGDCSQSETTTRSAPEYLLEPAQVRLAFALLIVLLCAGCADSLRSVAQAPQPQPQPQPQQAAAAANIPTLVEDPRKFRCSDGTFSNSQNDCLVAMAKARLPPSQAGQAQ
jgi:hypothetical protein